MGLWRAYLVAGGVATCLFLALPSGLPQDALYLVVGLSSVAAIVWGVRLNRPEHRAPWYLFAAGQAAWVAGDTIYSWNRDIRDVAPFPSSADVGYLVAYPLLAAGIGLLIRRGGRGLDVRAVIDSGIVIASLGLVSYAWIARPMVEATQVPMLERTIAIAYPIGDILLMAMLVRLVAAPGTVSVALRLLVGAVLAQIVADTALAADVDSSWDYTRGLDLLWLASYILWGASALHPRMNDISRRSGLAGDLFTLRRVAVLSAAALLPPVTAAVALAAGRSLEPWVFVVGSIVLTSLVLTRMASAIVEIRRTADQRDRLQGELFRRASHDPLTGLFNRAHLLRLIGATLRRAQPAGAEVGLVMVDLDDFKTVNAEAGPTAGDAILKQAADRIREAVGASHPVGRLTGDQFIVLIEGVDEDAMTRLAGALATALLAPYRLEGGGDVRVRARIGLAVSLDGGVDASELLHEALIANRRAKLSAPGTVEVFDSLLRHEVAERTEIEEALRAAIALGELELHYQPVVSVGVESTDGYEALVRWRRSNGELGMPDEFIPVAEKSDLICDLGRWVLFEATRQFAEWLERDPDRFELLNIAVNISGRHLADRRVVDDVAAALRAAGLPGHHLALEVTETVLIDEPNAMIQLVALRDLGVTISLDDFGTGYTSISQLRLLPVDTIKIDKSFLASAEPGSTELVALMTAAAHACGMLVVAEGVERQEQLNLLTELDCDYAQGYLISRPLTSEAVVSGSEIRRPPRLRIVRDT